MVMEVTPPGKLSCISHMVTSHSHHIDPTLLIKPTNTTPILEESAMCLPSWPPATKRPRTKPSSPETATKPPTESMYCSTSTTPCPCAMNTKQKLFKGTEKSFTALLDAACVMGKLEALREKKTSEVEGKKRKVLSDDVVARSRTTKRQKSCAKNKAMIRNHCRGGNSIEPSSMPPQMQRMIHDMGGSQVCFICCKNMFHSDVNKTQNRLTVSKEPVDLVLTESEADHLAREGKVQVLVVDKECTEWNMAFVFWPSIKRYAFISKWTEFVIANRILPDVHTVELWSFRLSQLGGEEKLCFAINVRDIHGASNGGASPAA